MYKFTYTIAQGAVPKAIAYNLAGATKNNSLVGELPHLVISIVTASNFYRAVQIGIASKPRHLTNSVVGHIYPFGRDTITALGDTGEAVERIVGESLGTFLGKNIQGEGLIGLTRGFMYAGAKTVAVSLWSVNDAATAELTSRFYTGMLKKGLTPTAALRAAQLEMWKQDEWKAPYYWAAFVIQG